MTKKVLVTGVSGFIGHHCVVELLKNGYHVKGSLRNLEKKDEVLNGISKEIEPSDIIEFIKLDLLSDDGWYEWKVVSTSYTCCLTLFCKEPKNEEEYIKPACEGTIRVLKFAEKANIKRVVLTSSVVSMMGVIYDSNQDTGTVDSSSWTDPNSLNINTYMKSKTLAEKAAWDFIKNLLISLQWKWQLFVLEVFLAQL